MPLYRVLNLTRLGWGIALPVLLLAAIGLSTIRATDERVAERDTGRVAAPAARPGGAGDWSDPLSVLAVRQVLYLVSGIGLMLLTLVPSYPRMGRWAYAVYGVVVFLLVLLVLDRFVDVPGVPVIRNTRRWVQVGAFGLQPSEFMKPALVLALARYLRFRQSVRRWPGLIVPFLMTLVPMVLILFQPDLGTLLMLLPVLFGMLFAAGARIRHLVTVVLLGCATLPLFYWFGMAEYQKQRIDVLLRQNTTDERWHLKEGYQLRQSKIALALGGIWGEGFTPGAFIRNDLLPDAHNDFIFALIGLQWGLVGAALVILAYALIVLCGLEVALLTNDPFGRLVVVGVLTMIVAQALLNMGMTVGLTPITGMTLPFVSFGGSSLWANFLALGLLVNVAQRRPMLIAKPPYAMEAEES